MKSTVDMRKIILDFVKNETNYFKDTDNLAMIEIGDGNVNYIYRLYNEDQSMIIKFSDDHVRSNANRKLSSSRNKIEYNILKKQGELSGGLVPKLYGFSEEKKLIAMEDLTGYKVLRIALEKKMIFPNFGNSMAKFLYDTLFKTTDLVSDSKTKKNAVSELVNYDMCEISERLVFTEPYLNQQGLNSFAEENRRYVEENIYNNKKLHSEVAKLKLNFMTSSESMIHGDLHSGSIFINDEGIKVFDPEFAFYGPMGYDIGNIVASLLITAMIDDFENHNKVSDFSKWLKKSVIEIIEGFINIYNEDYEKNVMTPMFNNDEFKSFYLSKILCETAGYAGTEILRRTIGVAKVLDIDRVKTEPDYNVIEKRLIDIALELITNRNNLTSLEDYRKLIINEVK